MIILSDLFRCPIDEGAIVTTYNLVGPLLKLGCHDLISINGTNHYPFKTKPYRLNKLLFNYYFYNNLLKIQINTILYIPESSLTIFTYIRSFLLKLFSHKKVFILGLQPRKYGLFIKLLIKLIQPECVIILSRKSSQYLSNIGIKNEVLKLGVDKSKFYELDDNRKIALRKRYKINLEKIVLLHVGHIKNNRNLQWFLDIKYSMPEIEILIVDSSYDSKSIRLLKDLKDNDIKILSNFNAKIEETYNLADYYVFPVLNTIGAIETPLSVLEAMACNLPIITTRFGSLPEVFNEDNDFHYVDSPHDITNFIDTRVDEFCRNRDKITNFSWELTAKKLVEIVEK